MASPGRTTWLVLCVGAALTLRWGTAGRAYPDPGRFEQAVRAYEAIDGQTSPPEGGVVAIGSSSIAG